MQGRVGWFHVRESEVLRHVNSVLGCKILSVGAKSCVKLSFLQVLKMKTGLKGEGDVLFWFTRILRYEAQTHWRCFPLSFELDFASLRSVRGCCAVHNEGILSVCLKCSCYCMQIEIEAYFYFISTDSLFFKFNRCTCCL